jgi:hypothetical protein
MPGASQALISNPLSRLVGLTRVWPPLWLIARELAMKKFLRGLAGVGACLAVTVAAYASVALDASTGVGFVGKGDVQLAFGWNNAALQKNASGITFTYTASTTEGYSYTCEWFTGPDRNRQQHDVTHTKSRSATVNNTIVSDPRVKNQITGFNLLGWGTVQESESGQDISNPPAIGDPCPGNPGNGSVVVDVTQIAPSGDPGTLHVNYGTLTQPLTITPPATTTTTL